MFDNIWQTIIAVISAVGGIGVIIVGLSAWLGKIWANRYSENRRLNSEMQLRGIEARHASEMQKISFEYEKRLEDHKHQYRQDLEEQRQKFEYELEKQKQVRQLELEQNQRYLEKQFDMYLDLWNKLQDLRFAGEVLWEEANQKNLMDFVEAYQQTRLIVDKVSLVIDQNNYRQLQRLLERFEYFRVGKRNLIDLRTRNSVQNAYNEYIQVEGDDDSFRSEVSHQIRSNEIHRNMYQSILASLRVELHDKLVRSPYTSLLDTTDLYFSR